VAHYAIARRDVGDLRTNLKDNCPGLMAQQMRKKLVRTFDSVDLADLRTTHARGVDLDQHLAAFECGDFNLVDDQRLALLDQNGGGCFQTVLTTDYTDYTNTVRTDTLQTFRLF
jgi:hypothetical protein